MSDDLVWGDQRPADMEHAATQPQVPAPRTDLSFGEWYAVTCALAGAPPSRQEVIDRIWVDLMLRQRTVMSVGTEPTITLPRAVVDLNPCLVCGSPARHIEDARYIENRHNIMCTARNTGCRQHIWSRSTYEAAARAWNSGNPVILSREVKC